MTKVVENLMPEARVEQVKNSMLLSANIEVNKTVFIAPVIFILGGDEVVRVIRITVTKVIPARASPLRHSIRLALELIAVINPVGAINQGTTMVTSGLEVLHFGLEKRQLGFRKA